MLSDDYVINPAKKFTEHEFFMGIKEKKTLRGKTFYSPMVHSIVLSYWSDKISDHSKLETSEKSKNTADTLREI